MALTARDLHYFLYARRDNRPLALFRILFGLVMAAESFGALLTGWVKDVFIDTPLNFPFIDFEWLRVMHGPWMYAYYTAMGLMALGVAAGLAYRASAVGVAVLWTGVYLLQKGHYNNHYYLMVLLCWMLVAMPLHRRWSLDVRRGAVAPQTTAPAWCSALLLFQTGCIYVFAALAKINPDWLRAMPLRMWLPAKNDVLFVQPLLKYEATAWILAYGGLVFDGLIFPALLWKRTRVAAAVASVGFHLLNSIIFQIGTFPYLAIALCVLFFRRESPTLPPAGTWTPGRRVWAGVLTVYCAVQLWLPLRHWTIPGDVAWTEEGHRMSWRMMLRSKSGTALFRIHAPEGYYFAQERAEAFCNAEGAMDIATHPDVCWQAAQWLKAKYAASGKPGVRIYADVWASLNGGPMQRLVDSSVDLAATPWQRFGHKPWVLQR